MTGSEMVKYPRFSFVLDDFVGVVEVEEWL